ncbi:regulator of condensation, partial [Oesophagostomum dentatum]
MMSCASYLDWKDLSDQEVGALVSHLCDWQAALNSIAHHETCLRLSTKYSTMFPKHCSILYLISAIYIISDKAAWTQVNDAPCRSISCGINGSAAITAEGSLVTWGDFTNQQNRPLETSGRLFSWGRNRFGQCGVGHYQPVSEPQLVEGDWGSIRQLSAGQFHSAILSTKGEVWTFGWGVWGQLGMGGRNIRDCNKPTLVKELNEPIKAVSCGRVHTVLLTESGKILVAGSGSYGQLGVEEDIKKQYSFKPLPIDPTLKFVRVATSFYHSVAITDEGRIFEWGRNPQEVKMRMFVVRRLR